MHTCIPQALRQTSDWRSLLRQKFTSTVITISTCTCNLMCERKLDCVNFDSNRPWEPLEEMVTYTGATIVYCSYANSRTIW